MSDTTRSEQACPACGQHSLAVDEPPRIDVMGIQAYSDMLGMGDVHEEAMPGIICLSCGTRWRSRAAFDRNEPEPEDQAEDQPEEVPADDAWPGDEGDGDGDADGDGEGEGSGHPR
jgi:hypothetical protein